MQTLLELMQNVQIELPRDSMESKSIQNTMVTVTKLFLEEEILSPKMILDNVITACQMMPTKEPQSEFNLSDMVELKRESNSILSPLYDYACGCATKMAPQAYRIPSKRAERTWRTVGTQTDAFELTDWAQFKKFISDDRIAE